MKVLIVGLGSIGMRHARNFRETEVDSIIGFDPSEERRKRFASELGGTTTTTVETALEEKPDLAVIASPPAFHISQAILCAVAGVSLLIEKPLGTNRDGVDQLIDLVESSGLFAHVGSNWKFHAAFRAMKRLLEEDAIGQVVAAQVIAGQWLPDWHPWEDYRAGYSARRDLGGGVILDSHEFDYLSWLLGPVTEIAGLSSKTGLLDIDTEDIACAALRFDSGALATVQLDYIQRRAERRYFITGELGSIIWTLEGPGVTVNLSGNETDLVEAPLGDINTMYLDQTRHVLDGASGKTPPVTPLTHAARALDLQLSLRPRNDADYGEMRAG